MRALSLLASFLALWAGTAMLLSRLPWFRDSVSLAERLAPYAPNVEASWTDEVERWLGHRRRRRVDVKPGRCQVGADRPGWETMASAAR